MFLFDTDVITNIFKKRPSKKLISKLDKLEKHKQFISTITISEIVYGAFKCKNTKYHLNNLKEILLPKINILAFDSKSAFTYGKLRADLELKGEIISHTDLQIASIAISNNLVLITGNVSHFERINNLKFENWLV